MQYAYIRVSSADQNTARQEEALLKAGFQPEKIYVEHASAKDTNRPELQKLLEQLRPGDTLLVHSIDRLCRNMMDMCAVTTRLREMGVTLIFLKEQLTFNAGISNPVVGGSPEVAGSATGRRIYSPEYPMSSLPYEVQNQRPTKNPIPDVVWRYSCIRTSGVSVPL